MRRELLTTFGEVVGIGVMAIDRLLLLFRQIIAMIGLSTSTRNQAYGLRRLIITCAFLIVVLGIGAWVSVEILVFDYESTGTFTTQGQNSPAVVGTGGDVTITIDGGQGAVEGRP